LEPPRTDGGGKRHRLRKTGKPSSEGDEAQIDKLSFKITGQLELYQERQLSPEKEPVVCCGMGLVNVGGQGLGKDGFDVNLPLRDP
jgi:hypothetical protein